MVVVDGGQGVANVEDLLVEVDVGPVQAEGFAFADTGADEDFDEVGHRWVDGVAVAQEADGFRDGPDDAFGGCGTGDEGGLCRVVGDALVPDGVAEGAGEGCEALVDGDFASAAGELGVDEAGDVLVAEVVEADVSEGRDEVVEGVVVVAGVGGGFEGELFVLEPGGEVVGEGLVGVGVEAAVFAFEEAAQGGGCSFFGEEAAAADGAALMSGGGEVDSEGPGAVIGLGGEPGASGPELPAVWTATAAPAVDPSSVDCGAHDDRFRWSYFSRCVQCRSFGDRQETGCDHSAITIGFRHARTCGDPLMEHALKINEEDRLRCHCRHPSSEIAATAMRLLLSRIDGIGRRLLDLPPTA